MRRRLGLVLIGLLLGVVVSFVFLGFEWVVNHGTDYIWNDLFNTDENRWGVVPLAIGLSLLFSIVVRAFGQRRVVPPHTGILPPEDAPPPTFGSIGVIFVVGAASLLAGASLGPEASLVAMSAAIGGLVATRRGTPQAVKLLIVSAVGALLVAFFGSIVPIAIPLLLLYQEEKKLVFDHALPPVVAGLAAFGTIYAVHGGQAEGYGTLPVDTTLNFADYVAALVVGMLAVLVAALLKHVMLRLEGLDEHVERSWPWPLAALLFGAGLGVLYLIGGESVQFSGREGTPMLLQDYSDESALVLLGLIGVKLLPRRGRSRPATGAASSSPRSTSGWR